MSIWHKAIEKFFEDKDRRKLKLAAAAMSQRYRQEGSRRLQGEDEHLAYLAVRQPATYSSIRQVLALTPLPQIESVVDAGSGPGTALWALSESINYQQAIAIELDSKWISLSKQLWAKHPQAGNIDLQWLQADLCKARIPQADLVIASYSLNELKTHERVSVLQKLYSAAQKVFIWIEPGTPQGFELIAHFRDSIIASQSGTILGPCTSHGQCPLRRFDQLPGQGPEWCHFNVRLERTQLHRQIKDASLGYEDEKFCYLVVAKNPTKAQPGTASRLVQEPKVRSGHVRLALCDGRDLREIIVTRTDKASYKDAKNARWGDLWPPAAD